MTSVSDFPVDVLRRHFPALRSAGPCVFFDNAAGAQVPDGIAIRDGHMYSPRLIRRLGLSVESGAVRASLAHYNTVGEIGRLGAVLAQLVEART